MTRIQQQRLKAALMAFEYRCEQCHKSMALRIFDQKFVCRKCWRKLERQLLEEKKCSA